jgi:hypothetical protein
MKRQTEAELWHLKTNVVLSQLGEGVHESLQEMGDSGFADSGFLAVGTGADVSDDRRFAECTKRGDAGCRGEEAVEQYP